MRGRPRPAPRGPSSLGVALERRPPLPGCATGAPSAFSHVRSGPAAGTRRPECPRAAACDGATHIWRSPGNAHNGKYWSLQIQMRWCCTSLAAAWLAAGLQGLPGVWTPDSQVCLRSTHKQTHALAPQWQRMNSERLVVYDGISFHFARPGQARPACEPSPPLAQPLHCDRCRVCPPVC